MRKIQRFESGVWSDTEPQQVKPGDIIRLFEPDGRPVIISSNKNFKVKKVIPLQDGHYRFVGEPA
ncbi:hypothetical protein HUR95_15850 [Caldalkalibacillus thermarum TA2.A1]|uniref:Uncharacterized protein n=1 Tax=Caldalkalibacillus thermarum (strain TA2.A1) TaxID=986075 RepID=A0A8X8I8R2_CALTT|nr:hypothetical protein [Caldalkalibacillus thermarum]QZT33676.1 hypothetical protein HUR95_15850 [Caldalkalibacillus thermarum TA2.A1]